MKPASIHVMYVNSKVIESPYDLLFLDRFQNPTFSFQRKTQNVMNKLKGALQRSLNRKY